MAAALANIGGLGMVSVYGMYGGPPAGETYQLRRFDCSATHKSATGNIAAISHLAGESVGGVTTVQTAAEVVHELTSEVERLLRRWG